MNPRKKSWRWKVELPQKDERETAAARATHLYRPLLVSQMVAHAQPSLTERRASHAETTSRKGRADGDSALGKEVGLA